MYTRRESTYYKEPPSLRSVLHYQITWRIENVQMCRKLLETEICGPNFGENIPSFPWMLTLGQSKKSKRKGISLCIYNVNIPTKIVNFRVFVLKNFIPIPFLDETYRTTFGSGHVWESPVLATNDELIEATLNNMNQFWEIDIQLILNESIDYARVNKITIFPPHFKLLRRREVGHDLKRFFKLAVFSDTYIKNRNKEIPAHKAILAARSSYLAKKIDSYVGGSWQDNDWSVPSTDTDVINTFLMYLYTGDAECITEDGPLPLEIYECAKQMGMYNLKFLTKPFIFRGRTIVDVKTVSHSHVVPYAEILNRLVVPLTVNSSSFGSRHQVIFSLYITINPIQNTSSSHISVLVNLETIKEGESIHAAVDLSVKVNRDENNVIFSRRIVDKMTRISCMKFPEFLCTEELQQTDNHVPTKLYFICTVGYSRDEVDTFAEELPIERFNDDGKLKPLQDFMFNNVYHGWMKLTGDLYMMLRKKQHTDCIIVIGSDRLPAHRIILAARSPYFSDMFRKKEEDCAGSSMGMEILFEPNKFKAILMEIILEAIYTGSADYSLELAEDIYPLAKFFGLDTLEKVSLDNIEIYKYLHTSIKLMDELYPGLK